MSPLATQRCAAIRSKAEAVLALFPATPVGLELLRMIAAREGIDLLDADLGDLAGTLRRGDRRWRIHLNRQDGSARRRCTFARLLGHYFLHAARAEAFVTGGFTPRRDGRSATEEWEAREFAAGLLMPGTAVRDHLPGRQPTEAHVLSLARHCAVSPLTMAMRLRHLGYTVPSPG